MSSTTTTWSTDTNTKSGSATTYTDTVSSLKLVGAEGEDAILRLFADEGDDNADQWRIVSQASTNKLNFMSFASGTWSNVISLFGSGTAASQYLSIQTGNKLYLDGGSDTYIHESSADVLKFVVGGVAFLDMTEGTNALVINEGSVDMDFRVESNGNANMLFVDGGENRVGIGTNSPNVDLHIESTTTSSTLLDISSKNDGTNADVGVRFFHGASPVLKGSVGYNAQTEVIMITAGNNFNNSHLSIDSNGNVGIGTAAPAKNLHISSSIGAQVMFSREDNTIVADEELGRLCFGGDDPSDGTYQQGAFIKGVADGEWGTGGSSTDCPTRLEFATVADTTGSLDIAMTIDSDGKVGIGTPAPGAMLEIHPDSDVVNGLTIKDSDGSCNADNKMINLDYSGDNDLDDAYFIIFQDMDGIMGSISGNGDATTYATSSDYRLKEDYKDIVDATGTINQLKLYDFAWKKNPNKRAMGVIAHEAQAIVPSAIIGTKDAMTTKEYTDENGDIQTKDVINAQGADYSKFVPLLLKAVQELSAKVEALESK